MVTTTRVARVLTISGRTATIEGETQPVALMRHVTASAGDAAVLIIACGQTWVVGVLGAGAAPASPTGANAPTAPTGAAGSSAPIVLRPVWSGTWRVTSWRTDISSLRQGDWSGYGAQEGAAYYGPTLKTGVPITSGTLTLTRETGIGWASAQTPTMTLLAGSSRPGGAPTVLATSPGPALATGASADWAVPASWLPRFASGEAGGIGITSGGTRDPYISLLASGAGMTLTITT